MSGAGKSIEIGILSAGISLTVVHDRPHSVNHFLCVTILHHLNKRENDFDNSTRFIRISNLETDQKTGCLMIVIGILHSTMSRMQLYIVLPTSDRADILK